MITKGIVEELKGYQAKVRLPIYDGLANTKNATSNENLSYATVCVTTNLNNSLNVGDIVYVSFEDNDKGKPVILGQLYKEEMNTLADIKLNSANINQLTVNKNASLPQNTSIGSISSKEIAALSGIKDNIQNQIDINLPAINFAESERQKSETDGAVTHNLDASVVFAESERQKSKNLFPYSTITGTEFYQQHLNIPIKAGTYTISALVSSSDTDSDLSSIVFEDEDKTYPITVNLSRNNRSSTTFTINHDCSYVTFFASNTFINSAGDTFTYSDIQLEEGSVATDYQSYNGQIVHEKQLPKITTLWTNPNPSNEFSPQTITLANDNFDYAIMICNTRTSELGVEISFMFEKGDVPLLNFVLTNEGSGYATEAMSRRVDCISATSYQIYNCYYSLNSQAGAVSNTLLIPYKVLGIKMGE